METEHPPAEHNLEKYVVLLDSSLHNILANSPFKLRFSIEKVAADAADPEAPEYVVDISGLDSDWLLERNAALLHALEHVLLKAIRLEDDHLHRIAFDCKGWRRMRTEELRMMAQVAADRVVDTGDPFPLSAMNARERRIIHLALKDRPEVRTQSEGAGPERKVVIFPK